MNLTVQRSSGGQVPFSAMFQKHQDTDHAPHRFEGRESFLSHPQRGENDILSVVSSQGSLAASDTRPHDNLMIRAPAALAGWHHPTTSNTENTSISPAQTTESSKRKKQIWIF